MINIIHDLRATSSRKVKESILYKHKDNIVWRKFLLNVYNPFVNYYIQKVDDNTFYPTEHYTDSLLRTMFEDIQKLSNRTYTGNNARRFAEDLSYIYGEPFRLILAGSIDAGITATTINKVYNGLIPTFNVMLGKSTQVEKFPVYVSTKFDGVRIIIRVHNGEVVVHTRTGRVLNIKTITEMMKEQPNGYYDAELVKGTGDSVSRTKISGEVNKVLKGTSTDIDNISVMIFDYLSITDWVNEKSTIPFRDRIYFLSSMFHSNPVTKLVHHKVCYSSTEVNEIFEDLLRRGFEGVIARYGDDYYEWKRTPNLIKMKAVNTAMLKCTGVVEGLGKFAGMVGALRCEGTVKGKPVIVKVGSGLSDFDRGLSYDEYLGENIEILYNDVVKNIKDNSYSLFLPRFKRIGGNLDT